MKKTVLALLFMLIPPLLAFTLPATAAPPPTNQYLGVYDTDFGYLTRIKCLECHNSDQILVQRHHALLNNVAPSKTYQCLTCHSLTFDGSGGYTFEDFRTCENCHTTSPHHTTPAATERHCNVCHGSFVDNFDDGHYIPTYPKSSVTPETYGTVFINSSTGKTTVSGGCGACHQPDPAAIDPFTGTLRPILGTRQTHHSTKLQCSLCHNIHGALMEIRQCESCHGIKSLHNIQKDSPAGLNPGTIVPGEEEPGWGHVGSNQDCNGCHLKTFSGASIGPASATVPAITSLSRATLHSGRSSTLTITGAGFVNSSPNETFTPTVVIGSEPNLISLQPTAFTESTLQVAIPPLEPGNYDLRVVKIDKQSNRARITAVPFLSATKAVITTNAVTISGSGFRTPPPFDYKSGLGVFINNSEARIVSWGDNKIVAAFRGVKAGDTVVIKSLNGTVSITATAAVKKTR